MAIDNTITRNQYSATASQTVFAYTFEIADEDDIKVEQNGTVLSKTTHYTVSGVAVDTGGNITLVTGATSGDVITIYRDMNFDRESDYQQNGSFTAAEINTDLDRLWMAVQQTDTNLGSAIRPSITDSVLNSTNTELANVATRAGKVLGFDATGLLSYTSSTIPSGDFVDVTTTAVMAALAAPSVGDVVQTAEFSTGNGGGGTYDCVTVGTTPNVDFPNTYNVIVSTTDATKCFVLRKADSVSVDQLGATGSSDDSGPINHGFILQNGKTLSFSSKTYGLGSTKLEIDNSITLIMDAGTTLTQTSTAISLLEIDDTTDVTIHGNNCLFQHDRTVAGNNTFYIRGSERVNVYGVRFADSPKDAIYLGDSVATPGNQNKNINIKDCDFDSARRQGISAIHVTRLYISGNKFHDISGDLPQAGIDLESNNATQDVSDVSIIGNHFYDITSQSGLYIGTANNVTVEGNNFRNNLVGVNISSVLANTNEKTISSVANASDQFTITAHNLKVGDRGFLTTTGGGTIPAGATVSITYRVNAVIDANTITLSTYYQSVLLSISDDGALPLQFRAYRDDKLTNIIIRGNTFQDMINQSVIADEPSKVIIQGNVVNGGAPSTASMLLNYMDDSIVDSNIISGTTDGEGIFCSGIRTAVTNNTIIGSPDEGIRFYGGEASRAAHNTLIDCGLDTLQAGDFRYFNNGEISCNRVWDESSLGVSVGFNMRSSDTTGNIIDSNNMLNSASTNANALLNIDRDNLVSHTNILNDGEIHSATFRASTTNLTDISHPVNTGNKFEGKMIFDSTTNIPMYARGSTAGDLWASATGGSTITPA